MARAKKRPRTLLDLPAIVDETGDINVVVETPSGSPNKYKYDTASSALRLKAVLGEGLVFPHDFGFVPSTLGEDGDPLDVLLFADNALPPCSLATARLIGVLEVRQREGKKAWQRNDRFLAVATHAPSHQAMHELADLRPGLLDEIESFFTHYAGLEGKELQVLARKGSRDGRRLLKAGIKAYGRKR
jgi:inorganic pyrophosphatase